MAHRAFINSQGFIEQVYVGEMTEKSVREIMDESHKYAKQFQKRGEPILVLSDLSKMSKATPGGRKQGLRGITRLPYEKVAIVTKGVYHKTLANFVVLASGETKKVKVFGSRDEASSWLST